MGQPLDIINLPDNLLGGSFQGFVEGWSFRAGYNSLEITLNLFYHTNFLTEKAKH
jgi:hypothetical protein